MHAYLVGLLIMLYNNTIIQVFAFKSFKVYYNLILKAARSNLNKLIHLIFPSLPLEQSNNYFNLHYNPSCFIFL